MPLVLLGYKTSNLSSIHTLTDSLLVARAQSVFRILISLFYPAYNHYFIHIEFKLDKMSARLAFVEARNRLAAQQGSDKANDEKKEKKAAALSKFLKGHILKSPDFKKSDGINGNGARVAFHERQQERAASDPRNEASRRTLELTYSPREPDTKRRVQEWLYQGNEDAAAMPEKTPDKVTSSILTGDGRLLKGKASG